MHAKNEKKKKKKKNTRTNGWASVQSLIGLMKCVATLKLKFYKMLWRNIKLFNHLMAFSNLSPSKILVFEWSDWRNIFLKIFFAQNRVPYNHQLNYCVFLLKLKCFVRITIAILRRMVRLQKMIQQKEEIFNSFCLILTLEKISKFYNWMLLINSQKEFPIQFKKPYWSMIISLVLRQ